MTVFKVLILVVWLTVPVVASYFIRQDYELYRELSQFQRTDCEARVDSLRRYTRLLASQGTRVESIDDSESRADWQRQWNELMREMENVNSNLRLCAPQYYPRTDEQLQWMELWRDELIDAVTEAARERDAYNKAGGGMVELAREIDRAHNIAQYYRSINARGIHDLIMDDVKVLEQELRRRQRERTRLSHDVEQLLTEASQFRSKILTTLVDIDKHFEVDEQRSYRLELAQRFAEFQLLAELRALLGV